MKAIGDYILVNLEYAEKIKSIYVPDQAKQYSGEYWGEIISVGPVCPFKDELRKGDKILYRRHEGFSVWDGEKKYLAIKSKWVGAKLEVEDVK